MASENKKKLPYVYVDIDNTEQPPIVAHGYSGSWSNPSQEASMQAEPSRASRGSQEPRRSEDPYGQDSYRRVAPSSQASQPEPEIEESESVVPFVVPVFRKVVDPDYYTSTASVPEPTVSSHVSEMYRQAPARQDAYAQQRPNVSDERRYGAHGTPSDPAREPRRADASASHGPVGGAYGSQSYADAVHVPDSGYRDGLAQQQSTGFRQSYQQGYGQDHHADPGYVDPRYQGDYSNPWGYQDQPYDSESSQQLGIQPYRPTFPYGYPQWYAQGYGASYPYPVPGGYAPMYPGYPYADPAMAYPQEMSPQDPSYGAQASGAQQAYPYGYESPYGYGYGYGYADPQGYQQGYSSQGTNPYGASSAAQGANPYAGVPSGALSSHGASSSYGASLQASPNAPYAASAGQRQGYPSQASPGPQQRAADPKDELGSPLLDKQAIADSPMFDEPPVPIDEGMKNLEDGHKKRKRLMVIGIIAAVVAVIALVVVLVFLSQGTQANQNAGSTSQSSSSYATAGSSSASSKTSSSGMSQSSSDKSGTVVYQYSARTTDGVEYNVKETVTFQSNGDCEFATMELTFPDEASATTFVNNLARDYGSNFTLDSQNGANAVVTIDNSGLHLDRDEYENALRYSVDDLVILKK